MARSKRSAALFEVIHSAKRPGLLRTPKWWFKGSSAPVEAAPQPLPPMEEPQVAAPVIPTSLYGTRATAASRSTMRLDRDRNEVTMRMRLGTVVVGAFAVCVALGLAYVVGQHVANGPKPADASDLATDVIRQKPPLPDALEVQRRTPKPSSINKVAVSGALSRRPDAPASVRPKAQLPSDTVDVDSGEPKVTAAGPRDPNKNYFLVGVYEPKLRKLADKTCDALNQAGVPCSIEKVPVGYGNNAEDQYVAVITRQGFTGPSDPAREACEKRIYEASTRANLKGINMAFFKGTKLR